MVFPVAEDVGSAEAGLDWGIQGDHEEARPAGEGLGVGTRLGGLRLLLRTELSVGTAMYQGT